MTEEKKEGIEENIEEVEEFETNTIFEEDASVSVFNQDKSVSENVKTSIGLEWWWQPEYEWNCQSKLNCIFPNPAGVDH